MYPTCVLATEASLDTQKYKCRGVIKTHSPGQNPKPRSDKISVARRYEHRKSGSQMNDIAKDKIKR